LRPPRPALVRRLGGPLPDRGNGGGDLRPGDVMPLLGEQVIACDGDVD